MESSTHHAPRFVDEVITGAAGDAVNSPEAFIAGPEYSPLASSSTSKSKQKMQSKASKRRVETIAAQMSAHLSEHGWAVCDSFLPLDLVRRVRIETEIFKEFFEQSEIWGAFYDCLHAFKLFISPKATFLYYIHITFPQWVNNRMWALNSPCLVYVVIRFCGCVGAIATRLLKGLRGM